MTEEEYFRKNNPDFCYGNRLLSPYWDLFQDGVEFGERQSEKKIEELERKLEQTEKDLADYQFNYPAIKELDQEKRLLGERCNQLLKDKGNLTDELDERTKDLLNANHRIGQLEQQIEQMKICWNCKFEDTDYMEKPCCECSRALGNIERKGTTDKWELKENE